MCHATNSSWWKSYTPPKGKIEKGEMIQHTASREVLEEIGIDIPWNSLKEKIIVDYKNSKGKLYKQVHLFIHKIELLSDIGLESENVPSHQLQLDEIDEAKFMTLEEIEIRALPRYVDYLIPYLQ